MLPRIAIPLAVAAVLAVLTIGCTHSNAFEVFADEDGAAGDETSDSLSKIDAAPDDAPETTASDAPDAQETATERDAQDAPDARETSEASEASADAPIDTWIDVEDAGKTETDAGAECTTARPLGTGCNFDAQCCSGRCGISSCPSGSTCSTGCICYCKKA